MSLHQIYLNFTEVIVRELRVPVVGQDFISIRYVKIDTDRKLQDLLNNVIKESKRRVIPKKL